MASGEITQEIFIKSNYQLWIVELCSGEHPGVEDAAAPAAGFLPHLPVLPILWYYWMKYFLSTSVGLKKLLKLVYWID